MVDKDQGRTVGQMKVRTLPACRAGERGPGSGAGASGRRAGCVGRWRALSTGRRYAPACAGDTMRTAG